MLYNFKTNEFIVLLTLYLNGERLAITLRYYATGDNLKTIAAGYCVGHDTAAEIVADTGIAIYKVLAPGYLKVPGTLVCGERLPYNSQKSGISQRTVLERLMTSILLCRPHKMQYQSTSTTSDSIVLF